MDENKLIVMKLRLWIGRLCPILCGVLCQVYDPQWSWLCHCHREQHRIEKAAELNGALLSGSTVSLALSKRGSIASSFVA